MSTQPESRCYPIRSFVRREGRLTPAQHHALMMYGPDYGLDAEGPVLDLHGVFGRSAPCVLDIGFGDGVALLNMAQTQPERDFIGVEVHRPGIGQLLRRLAAQQLTNVRVVCGDAVPFVQQRLAPASLDRINLFFPDPWPKKRHHKRRLIQPPLVTSLAQRLQPGGVLHLATDWLPYAEWMLAVLSAEAQLVNQTSGYAPSPAAGRPLTKFERRGQRLGHPVRDLLFQRRLEQHG